MKKKRLFLIILSVLLTVVLSLTAFAGTWQRYGSQWKFLRNNGSYAKSIMLKIDGEWYAFDSNEHMRTNEWVKAGGEWYYCTSSGAAAKNQWISGTYYVGEDGAMLTNAWTPDGYYVGSDGKWIPGGKPQSSGNQTQAAQQARQTYQGPGWVLTDEQHFAYEGQYVLKQNGGYQYDEHFLGATDDGYVRFTIDGGWFGPTYEETRYGTQKASWVIDCSVPKSFYRADETASVKVRTKASNAYGESYAHNAQLTFRRGNGGQNGEANKFFAGDRPSYLRADDGTYWTCPWNTTTTLSGKFPSDPENGDQIAIQCEVFTVSEGISKSDPQSLKDYGGTMFYQWIYTYQE